MLRTTITSTSILNPYHTMAASLSQQKLFIPTWERRLDGLRDKGILVTNTRRSHHIRERNDLFADWSAVKLAALHQRRNDVSRLAAEACQSQLFTAPSAFQRICSKCDLDQLRCHVAKYNLSDADFYDALRTTQNRVWAAERERRGAANESKGRYLDAIRCYTDAISLETSRPSAWLGRGRAKLACGQSLDTVLEDFDRVRGLGGYVPEELQGQAVRFSCKRKRDERNGDDQWTHKRHSS